MAQGGSAAERALCFAQAVRMLRALEVPGRARARRVRPHAWRRLTEEELRFAWPVLAALETKGRRGRPPALDLLTRFEAVLEAAMQRVPWRAAATGAAPGVKGDTLHRTFRRWARRGLWMELLETLHRERPALPEFTYFVCRAFRRAWRIQGAAGVAQARRTGFAAALRAPMSCFPDPVLSARCHRVFIAPGLRAAEGWPGAVRDGFLRAARALLRWSGGVRRIRRSWEPA